MKKIIVCFAMSFMMLVSTFALSIGFTGNMNSTRCDKFDGQTVGYAAYANFDLFYGLGFQFEFSAAKSQVSFTENSVTFTNVDIYDIPCMAWLNFPVSEDGKIVVGMGGGINFSNYLMDADGNNTFSKGLVLGFDMKYELGPDFYFVTTSRFIHDFGSSIQKIESDNQVTYSWADSTDIRDTATFGMGFEIRF